MAGSKSTPPKILSIIFGLLVLLALSFVAKQVTSSWNSERRRAAAELPQLQADLIAELERIGLNRSPTPGVDESIRFDHPPTMTSDDLMLLLRRIMQRHRLNLAAAVEYEERRELYVELTTKDRLLVGRFTFAPRIETAKTEGGVRGRIALIIDDFGYMHNRATEGFMNLPESMTFSIIPGHRFSEILAEEATRAGHEVIVHMPMEPEGYNGRDEKEFILRFGMEEAEVLSRVRRAFQMLPQAVGMNNHEGSLATLDTVMLQVLARELSERNKYFVDSYTTPNTRAEDIMRANGVPAMGRRVFLDNVDDPAYIRRQLSRLAAAAERDGGAIGIGHVGASHLNTLDVLMEEIPLLISQGYEFVLVSELMLEVIN